MWPFRRRRPQTRRSRYRDNNPLKKQLMVGILLFVLVGGLVAGVWYGTRVADWQITDVTVIGGPTIQHDDVEALVWQELTGNYFKLTPRTFFYTYPETAIKASIESLPRVKAVTSEVVNNFEVVVAFEEYIPEALWCSAVSQAASTCLFLDQAGYAFAPAPTLQGAAFVRYIHSEEALATNTTPFTKDFLTDTGTFSDWLTDTLGWYVTHVVYQNDIDIEYILAGGGKLKVTTQVPLKTTQANLETLLSAAEMEKERAGDFEYIDLRFGDKIFIRDVIEEPIATSSDVAATTSPAVATSTTDTAASADAAGE